MISIPFDYNRYPGNDLLQRIRLIGWAKENNGKIIRRLGRTDILGVIISIDFEDEIDAIAFRLKFGL